MQRKRRILTVCDTIISWPPSLEETCYSTVHHSHFCGVFGRINVVYFHDIKKHVAQKVVSLDKCSKLSVMAEAAILHLLSGHFLFPCCYGFQRPNMIFLEKLGQFKDDYLDVCIIKTIIGKCQVSKYQWVSISRQDLEGISFLHQLTILNNDIKADNVILLGEFRTAK